MDRAASRRLLQFYLCSIGNRDRAHEERRYFLGVTKGVEEDKVLLNFLAIFSAKTPSKMLKRDILGASRVSVRASVCLLYGITLGQGDETEVTLVSLNCICGGAEQFLIQNAAPHPQAERPA
jgi:hypothetical protein